MEVITHIKYEVGDKVWIMCNNKPCQKTVTRIRIKGGSITKNGADNEIGNASYCLDYDDGHSYSRSELADSYEELRDKVFPVKEQEDE